tara:strand:+ start:472 stop:744 length:273 start_codon:yes stop_codon:yes gene_type:complete
MKHLPAPILLLTLLFPSYSFGGEVSWNDLVKTDGLYYKKFTQVVFSGTVTGQYQGIFKNGKKEGPWVSYKEDGTVYPHLTGTYRNGVKVK